MGEKAQCITTKPHFFFFTATVLQCETLQFLGFVL